MFQNLVNYPVNINSKDRANLQQSSSIPTFKITDLINIQSRKKIYVSVPYVNIPPTWYNITTANNSLTVIEATNLFTAPATINVTIPPGNYGISDLLTTLTNALTAESLAVGSYVNTYSGSYNSSTGKATISIGVSAVKTFTFSFVENDLKNFIGFNDSYNNLTVPFPAQLTPPQNLNSYESPNPVNYQSWIPAIYLRCNIWKSDSCYDTSSTNSGQGDIMKIIPITSNGLSQISTAGGNYGYEGIESQRIEISPNLLNGFIQFSLTTEIRKEIVDLNGYEWQMVMLVQYSKDQK